MPESANASAEDGPAMPASDLPARGLPYRWLAWGLLALVAGAGVYVYARFDDLGRELAIAQRDARASGEAKARLESSNALARKQVEELKSLLAGNEAEVKKSREDAKAAGSQSTQFQERAKALEAEIDKLKGNGDSALIALRTELETQKREAAALGSAKAEAEARAIAAEKQRAILSERTVELNRKLEEAKRDLDRARGSAPMPAPAPAPAAPPAPK